MKYGTCEWKITLKLLDNHLTGESLNRQSAAVFRGWAGVNRMGKGGKVGRGHNDEGIRHKRKRKKSLAGSLMHWVASLAFLGAF